MKTINYKVVHKYQTLPTNCSQTALSILLSHFGVDMSADVITKAVPQVKDEQGRDSGTINQQLATWCVEQGYKVKMYTFDCQIIDQSWAENTSVEIEDSLRQCIDGWEVPALGKAWSNAYRQAYIDYLRTGSDLVINPQVTSSLLYELLETAPILTCVCFSTLYGTGRTNNDGEPDYVNGKAWNHSIVIHGVDKQGNFLIADPLQKPGHHVIESERMIAAISTAQIECDNLLFQIKMNLS